MKRTVLIALMLTAPVAAWGQPQPVVVGASYTVNDSTGAQTDPHVSGDLVAYTNVVNNEIRYHFLSAGLDQAIPNNGAIDAVSDVSGGLIVFTRLSGTGRGIHLFNTASGTSSEIDPQPGSLRNFAAIGGNTVAWVDNGITGTTAHAEILLYNVAAGGAPQRLTTNSYDDRDPAVAPSGNVISWTECSGALACDVKVAKWTGTSWSSLLLTTDAATLDLRSSTDGNIVAWERLDLLSGSRDIAFANVNGGPITILPIAAQDQNPSVSGGLIAFESVTTTGFPSATDILLYDTSSGLMYQLTNTPSTNERLTDIDVDPVTGLTRVVYVQDAIDGENVFAFSFFLTPPVTCEEEPAEDVGCAEVAGRPVLASIALNRNSGSPATASASFQGFGEALLCVASSGTTAGRVSLNGIVEVAPSAFKQSVTSIERTVSLTGNDVLFGNIAGEPGSSYTATIYGAKEGTCTTTGAATSGEDLRVTGVSQSEIRTIRGKKMGEPISTQISLETIEGVGCSSAGASLSVFALLALALLVTGQRRHRVVLARRK